MKSHYNCGKDTRIFTTVNKRLAELQAAGFDCEIIKSEIVQHKEIMFGLYTDRAETIAIMGKYKRLNELTIKDYIGI